MKPLRALSSLAAKALLMSLLLACGLRAQEIGFGDEAAAAKKGHVIVLSDEALIEAGKPQVVELRFRVDDGFHINSHTPASEFLIATALKLDASPGVQVLGVDYPKGSAFRLSVGDGETLDVYQGEFRMRVRVLAPRGMSILAGALRYQACDSSACFPPRTLPVKVALTAR